MSATSAFHDSAPWRELEDAYGSAEKIPALLDRVAEAKGRKLHRALDDLCSHALHQGTIYNVSPHVVRALTGMAVAAGPGEKAQFYGVLVAFAEAAREGAGCCPSSADDAAAILLEILAAANQFAPDLSHADACIRSQSAELLTASEDLSPVHVQLVRDRFFVESDVRVRRSLLNGLARCRARIGDWPGFVTAALQREQDRGNRFVLRHAQVCDVKSAAEAELVDELVSIFAALNESGEIGVEGPGFFEAVQSLGLERELAALLRTLELADGQNTLQVLAERLLRAAFEDRRTGWGQTSYSLLRPDGVDSPSPSLGKTLWKAVGLLILVKLFPFLVRRKLRKAMDSPTKGIPKIEYWGLEGIAPQLPERLSATQRDVLCALADKPGVWTFRTNLWSLFGLPDTAEEVRRFAGGRG